MLLPNKEVQFHIKLESTTKQYVIWRTFHHSSIDRNTKMNLPTLNDPNDLRIENICSVQTQIHSILSYSPFHADAGLAADSPLP